MPPNAGNWKNHKYNAKKIN